MSTTKHAVPKAPATDIPLTSAALVLCAHGQRGESGIAEEHAETIGRAGLFARVEGCSINGDPSLVDTLRTIDQSDIFLVPLLMADGYTYRSVLPPILSDCAPASARIHMCPPLGATSELAVVATDMAADLCADREWGSYETTMVVAAHGTLRSSASSASAERLAKAIEGRRQFAGVSTGFLEQSPMLADVLRTLYPAHCIVIGCFMDNGNHAGVDIPQIIAASHPDAAYTGPIGCSVRIPDLIIDLVRAEALKAL